VHFVILIHPAEVKRSVASGRMTHLCLSNSMLIEGLDFSANAQVDALIQDPFNFCVLLFPDQDAVNLSAFDKAQRQDFVPQDKRLLVFVLDGTWDNAKSMKRLSSNLRDLPRICFEPPQASEFREVRKQPHAQCFSTIEAVHHLIQLFDHDSIEPAETMLAAFRFMVNQQVAFAENNLILTR
jgi:DTW domain-containing protein YfiP